MVLLAKLGLSVPALRLSALSAASVERSLALMVTVVVADAGNEIRAAFVFAITTPNVSAFSFSLSSAMVIVAAYVALYLLTFVSREKSESATENEVRLRLP